MNLQSVIDKKDKAAQYMIDEITHIIKTFGKRDPGAEGEKQACDYMAQVLKDECGCERVVIDSFKVNPGSFYGWMWITFSFAFLAVACLFFAPIVSLILIVLGVALAILQFGLYYKVVDWMFPEKTSHNVTAIKSCKGEVKRRIFFNGHPDAAWEFPINYHFGGIVFEFVNIASALGALYYAILAIITIQRHGVIANVMNDPELLKATLWGLIFAPFWILMMCIRDLRIVVDGANDNLSGCYMGIAILKEMKEQGIELENTEVGVILSGSEEAGLRGAYAWAEKYKDEFSDVPTFIYAYDTIHDPKHLMVNYRDLNATVKSDKELSDLFLNSAKELGLPVRKGMVPPLGGSTDNAAFCQAGFRSAGITGLDHKLEDYYHTRRDTYDNMNAEGLGNCYATSVKVLEKINNGECD
ncbi:MAG: Zn-dependent exopeptidase M28 [Ruminococcaceae bacterium]|nr:Zn-dependent exopeptidase M28 [Oscillospiraceae bacterium]